MGRSPVMVGPHGLYIYGEWEQLPVISSFDVFGQLILPFEKGLSVLNIPRSSVFMLFSF